MNSIVSIPQLRGSRRAYWACQLAGWGGYGAAQLYVVATYFDVPWLRASVEFLLLQGSGLGLSHLLRQFARQRRWETLGILALTPRIVLASVVLGIPLGIAHSMMAVSVLRDPAITLEGLEFSRDLVPLLHVVNWSALFLLWCIVYFVILAARHRRWAELRQSELARALQLAELRVLKSQLNPHFLFNSLNTVRALIADDPSRAQSAVTQLARTLRYTLNSGNEELVTLEQELEIVGDYLALESLRFGERLAIERDVSTAALRVRIPVMLLQTVVENAIKHGIADLPQGGTLRICGRVADGSLMLEVENPRAVDAQRAPRDAGGVGLRNAVERLRLLFGPDATLALDLSEAPRAVARIRIPART